MNLCYPPPPLPRGPRVLVGLCGGARDGCTWRPALLGGGRGCIGPPPATEPPLPKWREMGGTLWVPPPPTLAQNLTPTKNEEGERRGSEN